MSSSKRAACLFEEGGLASRELLGAAGHLGQDLVGVQARGAHRGDARLDAPHEPRHAHHVELIEVGGEDRQEPGPLQQREVPILGLLQDPLVEVHPGQLAVGVTAREGLQRRQIVLGSGRGGGGIRPAGLAGLAGPCLRLRPLGTLDTLVRVRPLGRPLIGRRRCTGGRLLLRSARGRLVDGDLRLPGGGSIGVGDLGLLPKILIEVLVLVQRPGIVGEIAGVGDLDDVVIQIGVLVVQFGQLGQLVDGVVVTVLVGTSVRSGGGVGGVGSGATSVIGAARAVWDRGHVRGGRIGLVAGIGLIAGINLGTPIRGGLIGRGGLCG